MFDPLGGDGAAKLSAGDPEIVDWAISYLQVDPFHFRSGYHKSWLIRRLKRIPLTPEQKKRLCVVVLRALDDPHRAPSYYSRLAASLHAPEFIEHIRWRLTRRIPNCANKRSNFSIINDFNRSDRNA